jgi:tetratricopeptide (TPR) repeat protein
MSDKTIKSMMTKTRYFVLVAMMLAPLAALAQDENANTNEIAGPLDQTVPVAEEVAAPEAQPVIDPEEQLLEEFARYRRLMQQGTLDEADTAAKRIVEMAIRVYGPQTRETASALNNLGIVQHGSGQYDAAIQNFTSSIEIIEAVEDRLNDALVNPLMGLGAAQLGSGRPDLAQKTYYRATHITHVNEGPHNLDQIEILERIVETFMRMGDIKEARSILDRIHVINTKQFEKNPMGLLPSLMNRAAWQRRGGYYAEERSTYRRAIRIIESGSGKNDPLLIEPLRRLGESFYYVDLNTATLQEQGFVANGEAYFKRAARIAEKNTDLDWQDLTETKVALADYYIFTESQSRARKVYSEVWSLLSTDEERLVTRNTMFADPVAIRTQPLPEHAGKVQNANSSRNDLIAGRVTVEYAVSTRGRVTELATKVIPPEFTDMGKMVHREIRQRVFRPRLADGVPVDSAGLIFEHNFSYLQSDLDALREANAPPPSEQQVDETQDATDGD